MYYGYIIIDMLLKKRFQDGDNGYKLG